MNYIEMNRRGLTFSQNLFLGDDSSASELVHHSRDRLLLNQVHHKIELLFLFILFSMIILDLDTGL